MANGALQLEIDDQVVQQHFNDICKRKAKRIQFAPGEKGYMLAQGSVRNRTVYLADISEFGLGFFSEQPLEPGTKFALNLSKTTVNGLVRLSARVVHAMQQADGNWRIGCELVTELTPETIGEVV